THSPSVLGDAITMMGSIGFAMYVVLGKRLAGRYDPLTMTAFSHYAGALIVLPVAIYRAITLGSAEHWRAIAWTGWAAMFYMAIFSSAVAYVFYFWLLRYLEASQLSAFTYVCRSSQPSWEFYGSAKRAPGGRCSEGSSRSVASIGLNLAGHLS
ncbi:MAG TPA: DMT family transporter, partial [Candidatus Acidoferrum sp.]|nr:DMT family transporter [Candidatus Acidoferrum sp.]